ncbi:MAG TPA: ABC-F family ATP-binding cassette domain-containing protein [Chitinophagales bacterium]|nr:ABC-F family ATP-binding cassette domain-containing protein [Chitinophagales bacterium]
MNYLTVEGLSKIYDTKVLFNGISFSINRGQKVALVARNGAGKSTLLRIIMGKDIADSGKVQVHKSITTGYLEQEPALNENLSIIDNVLSSDAPAIKAIKAYEQALLDQEHDYNDITAAALERAHEQMAVLNAWDYELRIKQILFQLKITDLEQKVSTLSGGQKKRIALSKLLIEEPDFVIMDEPTNHLDIGMVEWLEEYLSLRNMTLLLVTHDRYFLDRVCTEIIEMADGQIFQYKGNYSLYVEKKAHRDMVEAAELDKVKNTYRRELEWVRRMPKARTTKSKSRLDAFEDIAAKATAKKKEDQLVLDVKMTRMGGKILEMVKVSKNFGDLKIVDQFTYLFKQYDKVGIVGKNGVGKTTFLNLIMELEKPSAGKITTGETIIYGYYSQEGMLMKEDKRVIEVVKDIAEFIPLADGSKLSASQLLTRFQFEPETQYTYVSKLSGGEKRRLYLMTILIKNPNFLILDEPTNDLDILTLSILEEFLADFKGCLLIVSHDRYFMDRLVDHLFVFEGEGVIKDFPGNYSDWRVYQEAMKAEKQEEQKQLNKKEIVEEKKIVEVKSVETKRKMSFKEKREFEMLENEIAELEIKKGDLEKQLLDAGLSHEALFDISAQLTQTMSAIDEKSMRWLELSEMERG